MSKHVALVIFGAFILCFAGFNNKYPLLTSKSVDYIQMGFTREVPQDVTITYGLFVAHSSWGKSLWLTIFSQSLMLSLVLFYFFRYFSNSIRGIPFYLVCIFFVTFLMSASISSSTIDPGVIGAISILGIGLLLFADNLIKRDRNIILAIVIVSLGMDSALLLTTIIMLAIYFVFLFIKRGRFSNVYMLPNVKSTCLVLFALISGYLLVSSVQLFLGAGFNIFNVEKETVKIPTIEPDKHSVISNTLDNVIHFNAADNIALKDSTEIVKAICDRYNNELREFYLTGQMSKWSNYIYLNYSNIICIILFLLLGLILKKDPLIRWLFQYFILANIMYALSNALIYGDNSHSQHHIAWIIVLPALIYLSKSGDLNTLTQSIRNSKKTSEHGHE